MGRPLKIQRLSPGSGIITAVVAQPVSIDAGYPQFQNMDNPTQVIPAGMTAAEFLGVVGGGYDGGVATATFPVVAVNAFFPIAGAGAAAYILTQKGQYKYLVAAQATVAVTAIIVGNAYVVNSLGTTNWTAIGAGVNPVIGDVFTATAVGTGTGLVSEVAACYLSNVATGALVAGQMNLSFTVNSTTILASRLTNKYIWDDAVPPNRYAVNFFVSGNAAPNPLAGVAVTGTAGQMSCTADTIVVGQVVTVTGTLTGSATGIAAGTYYVVATNGTTTFTLSATAGGAGITTTAGTTVGLTFVIASSSTAKSGADVATWTNGTGLLPLAKAADYTA
jgi:hypothetical protein